MGKSASMKKLAALTVLFALAIGFAASIAPALADPHKNNFQRRCPPNATTCK